MTQIPNSLAETLKTKGVTNTDLADHLGVHANTVSQWTTGKAAPSAGRQTEIAEHLDTTVTAIWPNTGTTATGLVNTYQRRTDVPDDIWQAMTRATTGPVDLLGFAVRFLPTIDEDVFTILAGRAAAGTRMRICLADPNHHTVTERDNEETDSGSVVDRVRDGINMFTEHLGGFDTVEIRLHHLPLYMSVYRFGPQMLVTSHLPGVPGAGAPTSHYKSTGNDADMFNTYSTAFDSVWADAQPVE